MNSPIKSDNGCNLIFSILRQVLFDIREGNPNMAKSLGEEVTMQHTKMKNQTEACYPCKITKTNYFFPNFSELNTKIDSF